MSNVIPIDRACGSRTAARDKLVAELIRSVNAASPSIGLPVAITGLIGAAIFLAEQEWGPGAAAPFLRGGLLALQDNEN